MTATALSDVDKKALDAACKKLPGVDRDAVAAALKAAHGVYARHEKKEADALVDACGLREMATREGVTSLRIVQAAGITAAFVDAFETMLTLNGGPNYIEWAVTPARSGKTYQVYICRPGGKTPHELRLAAESRTEGLQNLAVHLQDLVDELKQRDSGEGDTYIASRENPVRARRWMGVNRKEITNFLSGVDQAEGGINLRFAGDEGAFEAWGDSNLIPCGSWIVLLDDGADGLILDDEDFTSTYVKVVAA